MPTRVGGDAPGAAAGRRLGRCSGTRRSPGTWRRAHRGSSRPPEQVSSDLPDSGAVAMTPVRSGKANEPASRHDGLSTAAGGAPAPAAAAARSSRSAGRDAALNPGDWAAPGPVTPGDAEEGGGSRGSGRGLRGGSWGIRGQGNCSLRCGQGRCASLPVCQDPWTCATPGVNPNTHWGLRPIIIYQYWLLLVPARTREVNSRDCGGGGAGRVEDLSSLHRFLKT